MLLEAFEQGILLLGWFKLAPRVDGSSTCWVCLYVLL
jgi:hypothetical protein